MDGYGDLGQLIFSPEDLRRATLASLRGQDPTVHEHVPAPDSPRLAACDGSLEAFDHHGAGGADDLRRGDVLKLFGELDAGQRSLEIVAGRLGSH